EGQVLPVQARVGGVVALVEEVAPVDADAFAPAVHVVDPERVRPVDPAPLADEEITGVAAGAAPAAPASGRAAAPTAGAAPAATASRWAAAPTAACVQR